MADTTWTNTGEEALFPAKNNRMKFVIGGVLLVAAIAYLVVNAMSGNTQLYKTVNEFYAEQDRLVGRDLRVAGFVLGDTIEFTQIDASTSRLEFDIVDDVNNPSQRLHVIAMNEPKPDLLQHEAQALVEGSANENGEFISNPGGLLLKCPTRYEELDPADHPDNVERSANN
ncbi:MAG: cytochrome c maturation protein CcmE [Ardenticatenaceae bacterium]|nr:cytochrome c maturation protein CcmE [Anaerolineales bacterium]MCB9007932.1 cytochrome c maturation protein CcmE [Ardenticatenaceae bacterium]